MWQLSVLVCRSSVSVQCYYCSTGSELEVGSDVQCCILDIELADPHLIVSLNPKLCEAYMVTGGKSSTSQTRKSKGANKALRLKQASVGTVV